MEEKKKKSRIFDKVLMGAIIGGAIGSVVGASISPKKGKETRKKIVDVAKQATKKSVNIFKKIKQFILRRKDEQNLIKEVNQETKKIPHEHI